MHQFRKRPVAVTARQLTASSLYEVLAWLRTQGGTATEGHDATAPFLVIRTLEGSMRASLGDWIVRGIRGEFHPVRGDIFIETYEPDDQADTAQHADRAAVYGEVAGRLAADAEQGDKEGLTRIYRRSAARQVREWGEELRRSAAEVQQAGPDARRVLTPNEHSAAWHAIEGSAGEEGADPGTVLKAVLRALGIDAPPEYPAMPVHVGGRVNAEDYPACSAPLIELVRAFLDPDPCQFDHHGYCQAHAAGFGGEPLSCPHGRARKVLAAIDGADARQDGAQSS